MDILSIVKRSLLVAFLRSAVIVSGLLFAFSADASSLSINASGTITGVTPSTYTYSGSWVLFYLTKSTVIDSSTTADLCLGGPDSGTNSGSGDIDPGANLVGENLFDLGLSYPGGGGADCSTAGTYYVIYTQFPAISGFYNSFLYWAVNYDGVNVTPIDSTMECDVDQTTRIVDFNPQDNSTTTNDVFFDITACVHPDDLGVVQGVNVTLHNIDQNVILLDFLSPSDIYLLSERDIETPGIFYFSTTTTIGDGNYRLEACIQRSYLWGFVINPLSSVSDCESHQFVVNNGTFIGHISQNIFGDTNEFFDGLSATSSEALASTCNPLNLNFGIRECMAFLFVPDASSLTDTMQQLREGVLTRQPWGYGTRFVEILTSSATSSIPSFTHTIYYGSGSDPTPDSTTLTFDVGDMISGGGSIINAVQDRGGHTLRQAAEPIIQFGFGALIVMIITLDLMGMAQGGGKNGESRNGKLS